MRRSTLVAPIAALLLAGTPLATRPAAAQAPGTARPAAASLARVADSIAAEAVRDGRAVGVSLAVLRGEDTVLVRGYGAADAEAGTPVTPATVFRIGSVTKQFTAAAIMRLAEAGRLSLDDTIGAHLPGYPTQGHTVTIRHLLNHTSGIRSYTAMPAWRQRMTERLHPDTLVALFAAEPFDFAPGEAWAYNNSGYFLLGRIIERVSGMPYAEYLRTELYPRAGLRETRYCPDAPVTPGDAVGYASAAPPARSAPLSMTSPYAAGALCSTARDLVRWERALAAGRVVSPASYAAMTTPDTLRDGSRLTYGFGLGIGQLAGRRLVAHNGGINGFGAHLAGVPAESLTVAVLVNTEGGTADRITELVLRAALGIPLPAPARDLPLSADERARYVGTYALALPNGARLPIRIFEEDGQLMAQAQGQGAFRLLAQGDHVFAPSFDPSARLTFTVAEGRATRLALVQNGVRSEGDRVP